jgi:hypothetical protein
MGTKCRKNFKDPLRGGTKFAFNQHKAAYEDSQLSKCHTAAFSIIGGE